MRKLYIHKDVNVIASHYKIDTKYIPHLEAEDKIGVVVDAKNDKICGKFFNFHKMDLGDVFFFGVLIGNLPPFILKLIQWHFVPYLDKILVHIGIIDIQSIGFIRNMILAVSFCVVIPFFLVMSINTERLFFLKLKTWKRWLYKAFYAIIIIVAIINFSIDVKDINQSTTPQYYEKN